MRLFVAMEVPEVVRREVARLAGEWGYDGLEIACWGDHIDVSRWDDAAYVQSRLDILARCVGAAFLTSHGLRPDVELLTLHLGPPSPPKAVRTSPSPRRPSGSSSPAARPGSRRSRPTSSGASSTR